MIIKGAWILESISEPLHWFQVTKIEKSRVYFKNGSMEGMCMVSSVIAARKSMTEPAYVQVREGAFSLDIRRDINTDEDDGLAGNDPVVHEDRSTPS